MSTESPQSFVIEFKDQELVNPIQLKKGDTLLIKLWGNMTTGYAWSLAAGPDNVLVQTGDVTYEKTSKLLGAGEWSVFTFSAETIGEAQLTFIYQRPFEPENPPEKTIEVTVLVR